MKRIFKIFTITDIALWATSVAVIILSFALSPRHDYMSIIASVVGITSLIFVAKGHVAGQFLLVVFAVFYSVISYYLKYYGEMITYLGMSAPVAVASAIAWLKHPYKKSAQVAVATPDARKLTILAAITAAVTVAFYFILRACGNADLEISTLSVATSFFAAALTVLRSPLYAVAYALNDAVLIALWSVATATDIANLPMTICFSLFLINDIYGLISWQKMKKAQKQADAETASETSPQTENDDT